MEALGIDGKLLLAQAINFVIFYYIFNRFIAKPFSKFLKKEKALEEEKSILMDKLRKGEEERLKAESDMKKEMKKTIDEEMKKTRKEAEHLREDILMKAHKEAADILNKGKEQIESEKKQMLGEIKKNIGDMSMILISKGLNEYLSPEIKKDLTKHILNNLETQHAS